MKKLISGILALGLMFSGVSAAPFVQKYDETEAKSKIIKLVSEDNYIFALSENSEILVYNIDENGDMENIKKIFRDGFAVKDFEVSGGQLIIAYDSEEESHIAMIKLTALPTWKNGSFSDFAQITAAGCDIEGSEKFVYYKSNAENQIYVNGWQRNNPVLRGTLGEEYMDMFTAGKYMYIPTGDVTEVYDISSDYNGIKIAELQLTGISKVVYSGDYVIIATGNEVKVYTADFTEVYSYDAGSSIADMEISGDDLWVHTSDEIQLLDASEIGTELSFKAKTTMSEQGDIAVNGNWLLESARSGIKIYRNMPYEVTGAVYKKGNGEVTYSANFANYTKNDITAEIYMFVLNNGKAVNVAKGILHSAANSDTPIEITSEMPASGCEIRTIIVDNTAKLNALSSEYENESIVSYVKTEGKSAKNPVYEGEESLEISAVDEYGNVTVSGVSVAKTGRPVTVAVTYGDSVAYMNSIVAGEGSYGFEVKPVGYGIHNVTVNDGGNIYSGSFNVAEPVLTVATHLEDMGRETYISMNAANMQNAENIQIEIPYDTSALEFESVPQILSIMEGFEAENISAEDGVLSIALKKTGELTTEEAEFLKIAVKTSETASEGIYNLTPAMQITDILGIPATPQITAGTVEIREVIEKYDAIDAAIEVLKTVKASFGEAEYETQKAIAEDAREKIAYALSVGAYIGDFDSSLINTLESAEAEIIKYDVPFGAIDEIMAADTETIEDTIEKYLDVLGINKTVWEFYKNNEVNNDSIVENLVNMQINLPGEFDDKLYGVLVTETIKNCKWTYIDKIVTSIGEILGFSDEAYSTLTSAQQKAVAQQLAGKSFAKIADVKKALSEAIEENKSVKNEGGRVPSSGGGGNSKISSNVSFVTEQRVDAPVAQKPEEYKDVAVFDDIDTVEWAKEAINYLKNKAIINGVSENKFAPDALITREAFVKMLIEALEITSDLDYDFTDVDKNQWYYTYICAAANKGIIEGYNDGSFGIGNNITREEMTVIINRAVTFCGIILEPANEKIIFDDEYEMSDWAKESIYEMQTAGIINGVSDTEFAPAANATRAQAAKIIYEILKVKEEQGV